MTFRKISTGYNTNYYSVLMKCLQQQRRIGTHNHSDRKVRKFNVGIISFENYNS